MAPVLQSVKPIEGCSSSPFEKSIEKLTGESIQVSRRNSVWEQRKCAEAKSSQHFRIISRFPFIGRGSVMRDRLFSHAQVNELIDQAIRRL